MLGARGLAGGTKLAACATLAVAWLLGAGGIASAQVPPNLPPILPPVPGGGGGPSESVGSAPGEALAYGANPSRTGAAGEEAVFGPLQGAWSKQYSGTVHQALVIGELAVVSVEDRIVAYRASNGQEVWSQESRGAAPIASDGERVFVAETNNVDAIVRAFDAGTGSPIWSTEAADLGFVGAPVADGGAVYVLGSNGLVAISAVDGTTLWLRSIPIDSELAEEAADGVPAIDGARVYVGGSCGAAAYLRSDGSVVWDKMAGCDPDSVSVFGGRVFGAGRSFDAMTGGSEIALPFGKPSAFGGNLGYNEETRAFDLASGETAWLAAPGDLEPLLVGRTIYTAEFGNVVGLAASSGELLSRTRSPGSVGGISFEGITAGAGRLLVAQTGKLTAYAPVLTPAPDGIAIAASGFDLPAGERISIVGGVGSQLRGSRPAVTLTSNPKIGRTERDTAAETLEDGTAYFRGRLRANTRFTVRTATTAGSLTAYAYPRGKINAVEATSRTMAILKATFKDVVKSGLRGERLVAYYGPPKGGPNTRLATAKLHSAGKGAVRGTVRFRIPRSLGRNDLFTACIRDLPKLGYGRNVGLARQCGKRRVKIQPSNGKLGDDLGDRRSAIRPRALGFDPGG